jgi:hypothetical protein
MTDTFLEATLLRQLEARLSPATVSVTRARHIPWSSATFDGARHHISLVISGQQVAKALTRFQQGLASAEFDLDGHILADIVIVARKTDWRVSPPVVRLDLEALTVEADYRPAPKARRKAATLRIGIGVPALLRRSSALSSRDTSPEIDSGTALGACISTSG